METMYLMSEREVNVQNIKENASNTVCWFGHVAITLYRWSVLHTRITTIDPSST